jgi:hypothetical protein
MRPQARLSIQFNLPVLLLPERKASRMAESRWLQNFLLGIGCGQLFGMLHLVLILFKAYARTYLYRMMPQGNVYGPWPASGEIDIAESRGNDAQLYPLGNNIISSAMHWGTSYENDAYEKSFGEWVAKRTKYSDGFHTFGLEWSEDYLFTWLDGRLRVCS